MTTGDQGGPTRLVELAAPVWELGRDAFVERWGTVFLVHHGQLSAEATPSPRQASRQTMTFDPGALQRAMNRPRADSQVFPLLSSGRSAFAAQIWVGRARNNDVVIPDSTVSEAHAYFKETDGRWFLYDARSRNGTFVDDAPVRSNLALEVAPGARVRFGSVNLQFLGIDELIELVKRIATRPPHSP